MIRSIFVVTLACALAAACSRSSPPQATTAGDKAPAPATAPQAATTDQARPATATPEAPQSNAQATKPAPGSASEPVGAPASTFREVTIPADTSLTVTLLTPVASDTSKVEDQVRGTLAKPVIVSGKTVVPAGAEVVGSVIEAKQSGRVKGRALIAFRFERLIVNGESHQIRTARVAREAAPSTGDDVKKGGIGAGVGAIIGGVAGGGKGAVIGGVVGGTGAVMATRGKEVRVAAGTTVTTRLQNSLKVLVPIVEK